MLYFFLFKNFSLLFFLKNFTRKRTVREISNSYAKPQRSGDFPLAYSFVLPHSLEIKLLEAGCASVWDMCDLIQDSVVPAEGTRKVGIKKSALMETEEPSKVELGDAGPLLLGVGIFCRRLSSRSD